jgi:hypothetical protein
LDVAADLPDNNWESSGGVVARLVIVAVFQEHIKCLKCCRHRVLEDLPEIPKFLSAEVILAVHIFYHMSKRPLFAQHAIFLNIVKDMVLSAG